MSKFYTLWLSVFLFSCLSESNVDPGSSSTFIRYFNGGNNDEAKALEIASDGGYVIAATTKIQKAEADIPKYRIKFIKTDAAGNPQKSVLYPKDFSDTHNFSASSIAITPSGGYVISGEDIYYRQNQTDSVRSLILVVDANGEMTGMESYDKGKARGVAITSNGDYLLLTIDGNSNMYLLEIDKDTLGLPKTITPYPAGETTIANKLLIDETDKAIWSGVATKSGLTGIRVIKTVPSNINTEFDRLVSQPNFDLVGTDICRWGGFNYAVTGSTNRKRLDNGTYIKSADTDILFVRMNASGDTLSTRSFPFGATDNQNDVGNSISSTNDGGLILLSSVSSVAINGRGDTDFYLIRIDAFGNTIWTNSFGSKFKDEGVSVRQTSDGGYVVLGTTTQGALKIVTLLKTDTNGKIE